jgi:hypothetical protein
MRTWAHRRKAQAPTPSAVFESLAEPQLPGARRWLHLSADETAPEVTATVPHSAVAWSSIWPDHPELVIEFHLGPGPGGGTDLEWRLLSPRESPGDAAVRCLQRRMNEIVNRDLRLSYGQ